MARDIPVQVLTRFTSTLVGDYDLTEVLHEFGGSTVEILEATGAGVSLADGDSLRFVAATCEAVADIETVQQETKQGPCQAAYRNGEVWRVADISEEPRWPQYRETALGVGLRAIFGVPLMYRNRAIGALNVYHGEPRGWTDEDLAACRVLGDMATNYVAHNSELVTARNLTEQLQAALDSRVLIEQAKGIISEHRGVSVSEAFELLRAHARSNNVSLRSVAVAVVERGFRLDP